MSAVTRECAEIPPAHLGALHAAWTALSRLFLRAPTQRDLDTVRDPELLAIWPLDRDRATAAGLALIGASTEDAAAVGDDFRRLFVGPRVLVHPWESVHRSEEHLLFDEPTMAVRDWYARYGLAVPRLNQDPDDHIGLELEFLAHLAQRALEEPERSAQIVADLRTFLVDHVAAWAPGFAELVIRHARTAFYQGVGQLLAGVLIQSVR